jgi:hypothetical protein
MLMWYRPTAGSGDIFGRGIGGGHHCKWHQTINTPITLCTNNFVSTRKVNGSL